LKASESIRPRTRQNVSWWEATPTLG
jgi:hypothetical protein